MPVYTLYIHICKIATKRCKVQILSFHYFHSYHMNHDAVPPCPPPLCPVPVDILLLSWAVHHPGQGRLQGQSDAEQQTCHCWFHSYLVWNLQNAQAKVSIIPNWDKHLLFKCSATWPRWVKLVVTLAKPIKWLFIASFPDIRLPCKFTETLPALS